MDWYLNDWTRRLTGVPSVARALWLLRRKLHLRLHGIPTDGRMYRRDSTLQLCQSEKAETLQDEALLQYYAAEWDRYNRRQPPPPAVHHPSTPLTSVILRLVASIDQALVKKVVDSFVSLGLDVYKEQFEVPFLTATETYYSAEAEAGGGGEWEKEAEGRLREEEERVVRHLHAKTRKELVGRCESALLDFDADEDLLRMYALLARIPEGLEPLRRKFEGADKEKDQGEGKAGELDPKAYVNALLAVHEKNTATVARSFKGEAGFSAALDKACRELVNRNAATGTSAARLLELLAKRADMLLRKSNKVAGDVDLEGALNWVTFYTTKLSKRLIHGVSASDEAEASMISKLTEACGFEMFTGAFLRFPFLASLSFLRMSADAPTDVSLSKDLTDSFKERMAQNHDDMDIAFSIMHSGRKLTWLHNYSKNELRTNYTNQKYILVTEATNFSPEILGQVLALLVKAKVLVNEEKDQYDLNPGFKSKKIRVNLNLPIKADVKAESSGVLKVADEGRKDVIQVTIVRIMKVRKTMKNQALIQEVISQI
ncbi:Cullin family-domain-containing protein [Mycena olivaceomarginata]|nr:Cullin family-domain-containing protein [Mycena olivaceomarginata]